MGFFFISELGIKTYSAQVEMHVFRVFPGTVAPHDSGSFVDSCTRLVNLFSKEMLYVSMHIVA